jgi:hypothetical protein
MALKEPVDFLLCLLTGSRAIRVEPPHFQIAIESVQRAQISWLKAAEVEALCIQDDHEPRQ